MDNHSQDNTPTPPTAASQRLSRREFIGCLLGGAAIGTLGWAAWRSQTRKWLLAPGSLQRTTAATVAIVKANGYHADLKALLQAGLAELGVQPAEIAGKTILLKPNLVETRTPAIHINTHPLVVRAAVEAFLALGAERVLVAEGPGHRRDTLLVLEESGLAQVLAEDKIPFIDINYQTGFTVPNPLRFSTLKTLTFPNILQQVDWVVSLAKMKTHHWAGATLTMKNLFGMMPGMYYGWPKNVLHFAGIDEVIVDLTAALRPHLGIVDGIVGMEGDGPIMGTPKTAGVLVLGRNLPAVDATCARVMGLNPYRMKYLAAAGGRLGPINDTAITQRGETIASVRTPFSLLDKIPAQRGLRL